MNYQILSCLLFCLSFSSCHAQKQASTMAPIQTLKVGQYKLQLDTTTHIQAGETRFNLSLSMDGVNDRHLLDRLSLPQVFDVNSPTLSLTGDPRKKCSIAAAILYDNLLYALVLLDRDVTLRIYTLPKDGAVKGTIVEAGPMGFGTFANFGYSVIDATIKPVLSQDLFIYLAGGTQAGGGGRKDLLNFHIPRSSLTKVAFPENQSSELKDATLKLEESYMNQGRDKVMETLGQVLRSAPGTLKMREIRYLNYIERARIDGRRTDAFTYFFYTDVTYGDDVHITRYNWDDDSWRLGAYELKPIVTMPKLKLGN